MVRPQWIEPIKPINGIDHLGIQAVSISHYQTLFPGITNLTQRARYFSFYPWILSQYMKRVGVINNRAKWRDFLRRSEFLYALISLSKGQDHNIPGSRKATKVLEANNSQIDLAKYADHSVFGEDRYWKVSSGAYGQYYLGALRTLGIIQEGEGDEVEHLGPQGLTLSSALEGAVPKSHVDLFFDAVQNGKVRNVDLASLHADLSPSKIDPESLEALALRSVLINGQDKAQSRRHESFCLLLSIALQAPAGMTLDEQIVRSVLFYSAYPNGKTFSPSPSLEGASSSWHAYLICEHLNFALEVLFWAPLQSMNEWGSSKPAVFVSRLADRLFTSLETLPSLHVDLDTSNTMQQFCSKIWSALDFEPRNWLTDKGSEYSLANACRLAVKDKNIDSSLAYSTYLFARCVAAYSKNNGVLHSFGPLTRIGQRYKQMNPYDVMNNTFIGGEAAPKEGGEYIIRVLVLNRHIRVALEKLRRGENTFKFMLSEGNLVWLADFQPAFTNPRLRSAMNIAADLGLVTWNPTTILSWGRNVL